MIIYIVVFLALLLWIIYLSTGLHGEYFTSGFITADNTEFRGINMLGLNSDDGHFAVNNQQECQTVCARNPECKGYNYYQPGNRCYIYATGDFVSNRPGFMSGKKL